MARRVVPTGLMALRSQRTANPLRERHRARVAGGSASERPPRQAGVTKEAGSQEAASHGSPCCGLKLPATSSNFFKPRGEVRGEAPFTGEAGQVEAFAQIHNVAPAFAPTSV